MIRLLAIAAAAVILVTAVFPCGLSPVHLESDSQNHATYAVDSPAGQERGDPAGRKGDKKPCGIDILGAAKEAQRDLELTIPSTADGGSLLVASLSATDDLRFVQLITRPRLSGTAPHRHVYALTQRLRI